MILRAIEELPLPADGVQPRPVWDVLFAHQSSLNGVGACWLITQPSHSVLSGEMAAQLLPESFGQFDQAVTRAIALHDAGWSQSDSELIRASREPKPGAKVATSFLGAPPREAVAAWTGSVETALKVSELGGLLVSEHFRSIAHLQVNENAGKAKEMAAFARQEESRQRALREKVGRSAAEVERLVDGLRFCDLLSLCICMGITDPVELPQQFQQHRFTLAAAGMGVYRLAPFPFAGEQTYSFAALRHPRTKEVSGATFLCKITG